MATDDFNRADAGSLGSNWTETINGLKIVSNQATPVNFGTLHQNAYWSATSFSGDHYSEVVIGTGSATAGYESYVIGRLQGTGTGQDGYPVYFGDGFSNRISIGRMTDNGITQIQDTGINTTSPGDTIRVECESGTIRAYKNGTQAGTDQSDGTHTGGQPGLGGRYDGHDVFNSWAGGDLGVTVWTVIGRAVLDYVE